VLHTTKQLVAPCVRRAALTLDNEWPRENTYKVNDGHRLGADLAKRVDVRHDIVANLLFLLLRQLVINVPNVRLHFANLLRGHFRQAKLPLRFSLRARG